ncbi:MAG TPA: hypothetical protein VEJ47_22260 [Candidatus Eremiobacteraceae bacterium]|nr:hypothetical protein [Candidatus Eremiobacteraceae bacterium]
MPDPLRKLYPYVFVSAATIVWLGWILHFFDRLLRSPTTPAIWLLGSLVSVNLALVLGLHFRLTLKR